MNEQEVTVVPVEEQISQELVKHNVTDALIEKLKTDYMPLQIKGIDDKENYLLVKDARKECKKWRVAAEKICKEGRASAVAIQKAWVAKEKEVTDKIGEVEDHLEKQEKEYEAEVAKDKERRKRQQEEQLIMRQQLLSTMGALYSDGFFTLGGVSFEMSLIKECDPDIWEADIKPKFEEEYRRIEAEQLEQERQNKEKEAELIRQQEELEQQRRDLEAREATMLRAQEERERQQQEQEKEKAAAAKALYEAKIKSRMDQLTALGLQPGFENGHLYYKGYECWFSHLDITGYDDEKWAKTIEDVTPFIAKQKEEAEQKRLAEIEVEKEAARLKALRTSRIEIMDHYGIGGDHDSIGLLTDEEWEARLESAKADYDKRQQEKWEAEQEEKRQIEEADRQAKLEQAKDKEKWQEMMAQVSSIEVYEMRSSQYRQKAKKFRDLLTLLKALDNGQD